MSEVEFQYYKNRNSMVWCSTMGDMVRAYLRGEPIYVGFKNDIRRQGSVGRLVITNMQNILHGSSDYYQRCHRQPIPEIESNVKDCNFKHMAIDGKVVWNGRSNKVQFNHWNDDFVWLNTRTAKEGTNWVFAKPADPPVTVPTDKLGRDIKVGDFISYILYHFDNEYNAAGIYYGKVTKIEHDGTVWAKNIKLSDKDKVADKRIKDNSLIVLMTSDLMDKLMLARLSIL